MGCGKDSSAGKTGFLAACSHRQTCEIAVADRSSSSPSSSVVPASVPVTLERIGAGSYYAIKTAKKTVIIRPLRRGTVTTYYYSPEVETVAVDGLRLNHSAALLPLLRALSPANAAAAALDLGA